MMSVVQPMAEDLWVVPLWASGRLSFVMSCAHLVAWLCKPFKREKEAGYE